MAGANHASMGPPLKAAENPRAARAARRDHPCLPAAAKAAESRPRIAAAAVNVFMGPPAAENFPVVRSTEGAAVGFNGAAAKSSGKYADEGMSTAARHELQWGRR